MLVTEKKKTEKRNSHFHNRMIMQAKQSRKPSELPTEEIIHHDAHVFSYGEVIGESLALISKPNNPVKSAVSTFDWKGSTNAQIFTITLYNTSRCYKSQT